MSKKDTTHLHLHLSINISNINIDYGTHANPNSTDILGVLAHLLTNPDAPTMVDTAPATPEPEAPSAQKTDPAGPGADGVGAEAPSMDYEWPGVFDELCRFESAKNRYGYDSDADADCPSVIEVTDDWFRVRGCFTSKTGKGTRNVTLKVSRAEVADGSVKFRIA
jgi:hypothetical protein